MGEAVAQIAWLTWLDDVQGDGLDCQSLRHWHHGQGGAGCQSAPRAQSEQEGSPPAVSSGDDCLCSDPDET